MELTDAELLEDIRRSPRGGCDPVNWPPFTIGG